MEEKIFSAGSSFVLVDVIKCERHCWEILNKKEIIDYAWWFFNGSLEEMYIWKKCTPGFFLRKNDISIIAPAVRADGSCTSMPGRVATLENLI